MVMPQPFTTASQALVNYDATDVSNGTGYEDYYLIESEDSGGVDYHLTPNADFSNSVTLNVSAGSSDQDFDLTAFIIPRTINGDVRLSIPIFNDGGNSVTTAYLYKYDGSTETQLGSSITITKVGNPTTMLYMIMPIDNETIPAGEVLRLRLVMAYAGGGTGRWGIDPANRTHSSLTITTQSKLSIPYKLDL
jgi:hypothetical protein